MRDYISHVVTPIVMGRQRGVSTTAVELFGKDEGSDLSTSAVEKTIAWDYASSSATHEGVRNPYLQSRVTRKQNPHSQMGQSKNT